MPCTPSIIPTFEYSQLLPFAGPIARLETLSTEYVRIRGIYVEVTTAANPGNREIMPTVYNTTVWAAALLSDDYIVGDQVVIAASLTRNIVWKPFGVALPVPDAARGVIMANLAHDLILPPSSRLDISDFLTLDPNDAIIGVVEVEKWTALA